MGFMDFLKGKAQDPALQEKAKQMAQQRSGRRVSTSGAAISPGQPGYPYMVGDPLYGQLYYPGLYDQDRNDQGDQGTGVPGDYDGDGVPDNQQYQDSQYDPQDQIEDQMDDGSDTSSDYDTTGGYVEDGGTGGDSYGDSGSYDSGSDYGSSSDSGGYSGGGSYDSGSSYDSGGGSYDSGGGGFDSGGSW